MAENHEPILSVVVPAYNEQDNLPVLYERLCTALADLGGRWELIVVDDHSTDGTFEVLRRLAADGPQVRAIRMARNSGSHSAAMCAFEHVCGQCVVLLAADLQDPPEVIPQLIERWRAGDRVVWAARRERHGESALTLACAQVYYFVMRRIVGITSLPRKGVDFFLLDRRVVDTLVQCTERNVSIVLLISWLGFAEGCIEYDKQSRLHGESGWSLSKKIKLFIDSVTSFSFVPIRFMSWCGVTVTVSGVVTACVAALAALAGRAAGSAAVVSILLILGGLQMLMMGVLGEYVWRVLDEVRSRPRHVIERTINVSTQPANEPAMVCSAESTESLLAGSMS